MRSSDDFLNIPSSNLLNFPPPPASASPPSIVNQTPKGSSFDISAFLARVAAQMGNPLKLGTRSRIEYCRVCQSNICKTGGYSQGPRRHILQYHLFHPVFSCPHCPKTNHYDKTYIKKHMRKIHPELGGEVIVEDKTKYAKEEAKWFARCFGTGKEELFAQLERELPSPASMVPMAIDRLPSPSLAEPSPPPRPSSTLSHSIERILSVPSSSSSSSTPSPSPFPIFPLLFPFNFTPPPHHTLFPVE